MFMCNQKRTSMTTIEKDCLVNNVKSHVETILSNEGNLRKIIHYSVDFPDETNKECQCSLLCHTALFKQIRIVGKNFPINVEFCITVQIEDMDLYGIWAQFLTGNTKSAQAKIKCDGSVKIKFYITLQKPKYLHNIISVYHKSNKFFQIELCHTEFDSNSVDCKTRMKDMDIHFIND